MPYGIVSASDEFQRLTGELFRDLQGVTVVVDDVLVWGGSEKEHDARLEKVLRRCVEAEMVLNR